ncbi:hypothetical protein Bca101_027159 [Brassica carinata]
MGCTENLIYLCLRIPQDPNPSWFTLSLKALDWRLVPVRSYFYQPLDASSMVAHGCGIYVMGGRIGRRASSSVMILDCRSNTWTTLPSMGVARYSAAAGVVDGKIYILGGCDDRNMGRYSYSQPSSSDDCDIDLACLLQGEADAYQDEADSELNAAEVLQYSPQPEADDGIPRTCYCGAQPVLATANTSKGRGRRYYTCDNVDDGDIHVWKWWDTAVLEEIIDIQREVRELKVQAKESEKKLVTVEVRIGGASEASKTRFSPLEGSVMLLSYIEHCLTMDNIPGYVNFLNSQIPYESVVNLDEPEPAFFSSQSADESAAKERRMWSPKEDVILIGAWLKTSKDAVVSNEQKADSFWRRIQHYYNSSPLLVGITPRQHVACKKRWGRINDQVCKFVGCFDAAMREHRILITPGGSCDMTRNGALPQPLRNPQKRRKKAVTEAEVLQTDGEEQVGEPEVRPPGVKAAKAAIKRSVVTGALGGGQVFFLVGQRWQLTGLYRLLDFCSLLYLAI